MEADVYIDNGGVGSGDGEDCGWMLLSTTGVIYRNASLPTATTQTAEHIGS